MKANNELLKPGEKIQDSISNCVKASQDRRLQLGITEDLERPLIDVLNNLGIQNINKVLTDIEEPGKAIEQATKKLENAINTLEKSREFIDFFSRITNIFGAIVAAITSPGSGGIAIIGELIKAFENLTA